MSLRNWSAQLLILSLSGLLLTGCGGGDDKQTPDPVVLDFKIAYIKRSLPLDDNDQLIESDIREPFEFRPGARLIVRDRASPSALETDITTPVIPPAPEGEEPAQYDVRDLSVSADGSKLLFALRFPELEDADDDEQPTWNIWEYDSITGTLRRVIASDITAEAGQDVSPRYLPDGRIVFASTRQRQAKAILLDEGKPQFAHQEESDQVDAVSLHVMNADGTDIHQISFNQSHDLDPSVLPDGRIVFSRWDNSAQDRGMHLYTIRPDGADLNLLYGLHSHDTGTDGAEIQFLKPQALPDGRVLTIARPFESVFEGGDLLAINVADYIDNEQPTAAAAGLLGPAQQSVAPPGIRTDDQPSPAGRYRNAFPLFDGTGRFLVSWSQCRVLDQPGTPEERVVPCTPERLADPEVVEADQLFSIYVYDPSSQTQIPVFTPEEGSYYTDPVALVPSTPPAVIVDGVPGVDLDQELFSAGVGVLHIRSVYDIDGVDTAPGGIAAIRDPAVADAADRPARYIRIEKAVSQPEDDIVDLDNSAFGFTTFFGMREVLGYVPIEPDGSAMFKVPANVAFNITILDGNGHRIGPRHNNWLQLRPGEVRECNGCHTPNSELPHGRRDAEAPSANPGAPSTGLPFPNTEPALSLVDAGDTMAQVWARSLDPMSSNSRGPRTPSIDLVYSDDWTDPVVRPKDMPFNSATATDLLTERPTSDGCLAAWSNLCRITIHYQAHIQPIWEWPRPGPDLVLRTVDPLSTDDQTCTDCHNVQDINGAAQVPAGQLDLRAGTSADDPDFITSYVELFQQDTAQSLNGMGVLVDGAIETRTDAIENPVGSGLFECPPGTGTLVLGPPAECVLLTPINAPSPVMQIGNAGNSRFFLAFRAGGVHAGWLTDAELKLLAEWLDIGAQYFNDPFADGVPVN